MDEVKRRWLGHAFMFSGWVTLIFGSGISLFSGPGLLIWAGGIALIVGASLAPLPSLSQPKDQQDR
jgi:hypothetical protein